MASKTNSKNNVSPKPDRNYSLIKAIRQEKEYKHNVLQRDVAVRKFLISECKVTNPQDAIPGQLISFNYLKPKYKDELEYYDAMPMTIFFGVFESKEGRRVLGFNLHYYPPRIRYKIMDRIFEIWKPMYFKAWNEGLKNNLNYFNYVWLTEQLEKIGLSFGVRMYIPELIAQIRVVPPKFWSKAVFTEGVFKKKTRQIILNYWKKFTLKETQTTS